MPNSTAHLPPIALVYAALAAMKFFEFFRTLLHYLRPYRAHSALLAILLLIDVIFTTAWPLGFMVIIDTVLPARDERLLAIVIGTLLAGSFDTQADGVEPSVRARPCAIEPWRLTGLQP